MSLDEPVELVAYDPRWRDVFASEAARLWRALGPRALAVEHIGSTSVPGLAAKPIIDIMIAVDELSPHAPASLVLTALGYEDFGEAGVPGRLYFRQRRGDHVNVHLTQFHGPLWSANLTLRDYLRAHAAEARQYEAAKRTAVLSSTLLAYSAAKAPHIAELLARAKRWRAQ